MHTLYVLCGASGSGKSTLEKSLCEYEDGKIFKKIVSTTTREIREGEVDGEDYHFITNEEFTKKNENKEFIQYTEFAGNRYGSTKSEYETTKNGILVAVPQSVVTFIPDLKKVFPDIVIKTVMFAITKRRLQENMEKRGDNLMDVHERVRRDNINAEFNMSLLPADYIITDDFLHEYLPNAFIAWMCSQGLADGSITIPNNTTSKGE